MAQGSKPAPANAGDSGAESDLAIIREQTREGLELLRALVGLLMNKPERDGPTLEDLIAALLAQQRDMLILLRQIATDQNAILDRLPAIAEGGGRATGNGHASPDEALRS